jgi:hypothetical protein
MALIDQLERLTKQHAAGGMTDAEFDRARAALLGRIEEQQLATDEPPGPGDAIQPGPSRQVQLDRPEPPAPPSVAMCRPKPKNRIPHFYRVPMALLSLVVAGLALYLGLSALGRHLPFGQIGYLVVDICLLISGLLYVASALGSLLPSPLAYRVSLGTIAGGGLTGLALPAVLLWDSSQGLVVPMMVWWLIAFMTLPWVELPILWLLRSRVEAPLKSDGNLFFSDDDP